MRKSREFCGNAIFSEIPLASFVRISITFAALPAEALAKAGKEYTTRLRQGFGG